MVASTGCSPHVPEQLAHNLAFLKHQGKRFRLGRDPTMASKRLNCSLACSTQVVLELETRCLNVKLLIFLALHYNTKIPWKYNVGGADVFQMEMEMEEVTRSPNKWRMSRVLPGARNHSFFTGAGGKCCSVEATQRIFGHKIFGQDRQNRTWHGFGL